MACAARIGSSDRSHPPLHGGCAQRICSIMTDKPDSDWKKKAAYAAGAAVGSAAIAAALLFANRRRKDKAEGHPPATPKAQHYPPETD